MSYADMHVAGASQLVGGRLRRHTRRSRITAPTPAAGVGTPPPSPNTIPTTVNLLASSPLSAAAPALPTQAMSPNASSAAVLCEVVSCARPSPCAHYQWACIIVACVTVPPMLVCAILMGACALLSCNCRFQLHLGQTCEAPRRPDPVLPWQRHHAQPHQHHRVRRPSTGLVRPHAQPRPPVSSSIPKHACRKRNVVVLHASNSNAKRRRLK